jgi:hypothetical protein
MTTSPGSIAAFDQYFARASTDLANLIAAYQAASEGEDRTDSLMHLVQILANPAKSDGTPVNHQVHVSTMATTLAVAIDKLARA